MLNLSHAEPMSHPTSAPSWSVRSVFMSKNSYPVTEDNVHPFFRCFVEKSQRELVPDTVVQQYYISFVKQEEEVCQDFFIEVNRDFDFDVWR